MANENETKKAPEAAKKSERTPARSQASRQRAESLGFLAIVAGILIALNLLGFLSFFARVDATRDRVFTLSEGSRRVARELDDTLTITAYFTPDLPPPFNAQERYVRDILAEYEAASNGHVQVRVVHPDDEEEREEAERAGVRLMQHQRLESDRVAVMEGYRGLVFEYVGDRHVIASLPQDTSGLEYAITMAIKQLTGEDIAIGVLSGHESPTPTKGLSTLQRMLPTYTIREVDASQEIDRNIKALLIVDPQSELSDVELRRIDQFVMRGGSLGIFGGSMKVATDAGPDIQAQPTNSGVNRLLEAYGVRMQENIIADARCGTVPLRTPLGFAIPVPYPPAPTVPITEEQASHPVLFRLEQAQLFFTSGIETLDRFREMEGTSLLRSSEESWSLSGDDVNLRIRQPREWEVAGFDGPHTLAVAVTGTLPSAFAGSAGEGDAASIETPERSESEVRLFVIGTSTILRDEFLPPAERVEEAQLAGAMALPLNAIDWLAQDSDLIAVRAKSIEEPALDVPRGVTEATEDAMTAFEGQDEAGAQDALERRQAAVRAWDQRKNLFKWGNTFAIPLAVAAFGLIRWQMRQRKKATLKL
ncbi:GldG family protein [Sandaracinus amylolyticus]|uniref:GldG family protein n=1 Tax=Sandaracinus amylolyticus TaxID=927083 RepID=UPI001F450376|nr:Gldg family protein [Sandaracinus amylolyticus]UJR79680.1 Gliding motility protein GldG [Sandaracinus amylolyticus]